MYRALIIDFSKDKKCFFCKSGKTLKFCVTIQDISSGEVYVSSKSCYEKNIDKFKNKNDNIPNLTKGVIRENSESQYLSKRFAIERDPSSQISNLEYLILRQEKLSDIDKMKYDGIQDIYENYKKGLSLTEIENNRLDRFIETTKKIYPEFSPMNLQRLYACVFWLDYAIINTDYKKTQEFLQSILHDYKKYRMISKKQADCVSATFERINNKITKIKDKIPVVKFIIRANSID